MSCGDYTLTLVTPAGYAPTHQLRVNGSWPVANADCDVYLLDSAGKQVACAASSSDPETILTAPNAGTYTVRVVPYAPAGQSISTTISLVDNQVAPPPPPAKVPASGFGNYPAPETLANAFNAGKPLIGFDTKTGMALYQAYLSTYRVGFDDATSPATATYVDRSASAAKGCPGGAPRAWTRYLPPTGSPEAPWSRSWPTPERWGACHA